MIRKSFIPELCIIDFGLSSEMDNLQELNNVCGTPNYIDPEVLNGTALYNEKSEVFSLGSIFFTMITN